MTYDSTLTIKTKKDLKHKAKKFFATQGVSLSEVINQFLYASILNGKREQIAFTRIIAKDLTKEERLSLEEMRSLELDDFVVSSNPYDSH